MFLPIFIKSRQNLERVRLTGKIFLTKELAAIFGGWRTLQVSEVVNSDDTGEGISCSFDQAPQG
jgi:hypothetical protein